MFQVLGASGRWQLELALRALEISPGGAVAISGALKSRGQERKRFDREP